MYRFCETNVSENVVRIVSLLYYEEALVISAIPQDLDSHLLCYKHKSGMFWDSTSTHIHTCLIDMQDKWTWILFLSNLTISKRYFTWQCQLLSSIGNKSNLTLIENPVNLNGLSPLMMMTTMMDDDDPLQRSPPIRGSESWLIIRKNNQQLVSCFPSSYWWW